MAEKLERPDRSASGKCNTKEICGMDLGES